MKMLDRPLLEGGDEFLVTYLCQYTAEQLIGFFLSVQAFLPIVAIVVQHAIQKCAPTNDWSILKVYYFRQAVR